MTHSRRVIDMSPLRAYASVLQARLRVSMQYRAAAAAGIGTRLFWGLIRMMVFQAFYYGAATTQPMTLPDLVTYVWLGQGMLALILWRPDPDVRQMIERGSIANELLRPVDLYTFWYSRAVASILGPTLLQAIPVYLIALLFLGMRLPPTIEAGFAFLLATALAVALSGALVTFITISLLWTLSGEGMARLMPVLTYVLCGIVVPIPLFPDWAQRILEALPFRGLIDIPFRFYLGQLPLADALPALAHQLGWTLAIILAGRLLLARGLRRVVLHGS